LITNSNSKRKRDPIIDSIFDETGPSQNEIGMRYCEYLKAKKSVSRLFDDEDGNGST